MAKPIITLNGLKIVIMLGMLVIILCGIRFAAEIIVPFILALFIAVILNPAGATHGPLACAACTGGVDFDDHHRDGDGVAISLSGFRAQRVDADVTAISQLYYDAAASA